MGNATVKVITELKEFQSLKGVWDELLPKCGDDASIYLTHEWQLTWWKHFGEGNKLNILLIEKEQGVIGIIPLMKTEYRLGFIKVDALVTIAATNCNYIGLIPPESREEAMTALLAYLEKELANGLIIFNPTLIPEESKFLDVLRKNITLSSRNLVMQERVMTIAPYIPLPATWEEYFSSLSNKRRQRLRGALRELEQTHSVRFEACTADSLDEKLTKFFDLHQERWHSVNVSGTFSNSKTKEFYRDIARQFLKKKWLYFTCLTVDDKVVSAEYGLIYNRKYYALTAARNIRYLDYDVGHLHRMFLIKETIRRQLREFDFLKGGEPYKFYWTKSARRYIQARIIRKGFRLSLLLKFSRLFWLLYSIRQAGWKEIYALYKIKRAEEKEKKKMRLSRKLV